MTQRTKRAEQGFSMVEMVIVIGLALVMMGIAVVSTMSLSYNAKANNAMDQLISQLRQGREMAIAKRRNVEVTFTAPNEVQLTVLTLPGEPIPTPIPPVFLNDNIPNGTTYQLFPGLPDTPMNFGNGTAINLQEPTGGTAWSVMFSTSGAFVSSTQSAANLYLTTNNSPVNASIFMGVTGKPASARAVTIFGSTGRVRAYFWTGTSWQE
jgi:type II secretory pathway pseudopilin PulG